jgi:hypothetical protein
MYFGWYEQEIESSTIQRSLIICDSTFTISNNCMYSIAAVSHITQITPNLSDVHNFVIIKAFCGAFLTVKVTRGCKKLHNELRYLYSSPNMGRKYSMDGRDKKVIKQFW